MIDKINISASVRLTLKDLGNGQYQWKDLNLFQDFNMGEYVGLIGTLRNLRIKYNGFRLSITNSLHKYFHGNNYCDYSFKDLSVTIRKLCDYFELKPQDFKIHSVELGANLRVNKIVSDHWQRIRGYKMKQPTPMKTSGCVYGTKMDLTEFSVKIYNKTIEHKYHEGERTPENICRVEIEIKKMRQIPFVITLQDLLVKENIKSIIDILKERVAGLDFYPTIMFLKQLSNIDRKFVFAGLDSEFWTAEKKINQNAFKKQRLSFKKLMNTSEPYFDLNDEIDSKFKKLLN